MKADSLFSDKSKNKSGTFQSNRSGFQNRARSAALLGMCVAVSMMLSYVESFFSIGISGVKPGLANIVTVFLIYRASPPAAAAAAAVRIVLSAIFFGTPITLIYSAAGAVLSIAGMWILKRRNLFSPIGVSVAGGVLHNAGQLLVAIAITGTVQAAYYLPVLILSGVLAGIAVGICGGILLKKLPLQTYR